MPLISTIIPAYNAAAFVREAVESALAQIDADQEIIVVNDGSTDDTPEILARFGDRIHVINQENRGLPATRNRGAAAARGEWLAFLDADDVWLPEKLRSQLALAHDCNCRFTARLNFGEIERVNNEPPRLEDSFFADPFTSLLLGNPITVSSVIFRRSTFQELGGFDTNPDYFGCEDWELWLRYASLNGKFACDDRPLTKYRLHSASMSKKLDRMHTARLAVLRRALATHRGREVSRRTVSQAYGGLWLSAGWDAAPVSRWRSFAAYGRSLWYQPASVEAYKGIVKTLLGRD